MTSDLIVEGTHRTRGEILSQCLPIFVGEPKSMLMKNVLNPLGRSGMHLRGYKSTPSNLSRE
jgi:hypothetical protein